VSVPASIHTNQRHCKKFTDEIAKTNCWWGPWLLVKLRAGIFDDDSRAKNVQLGVWRFFIVCFSTDRGESLPELTRFVRSSRVANMFMDPPHLKTLTKPSSISALDLISWSLLSKYLFSKGLASVFYRGHAPHTRLGRDRYITWLEFVIPSTDNA
jgi:hypothetical protein